MLSINLEFKTPAASVVSDVINVLKKLEMIALFVACFVLGKSQMAVYVTKLFK